MAPNAAALLLLLLLQEPLPVTKLGCDAAADDRKHEDVCWLAGGSLS